MEDDKKTLRVLNDNVLLIQHTQQSTQSGIVLSPKAQSQEVKIICYVSAIGPDVINKDLLQEGQFVVIPRQTGTWVPFDGFKYVLVKESDILCIIEGLNITDCKEDNIDE